MAIPVIESTTSVLGYLQHQQWAYQMYARNVPTGWVSSPLPAGVTLNGATGLISGAATVAGVYNVAVRASNGDGTSEALILTIGIEAANADPNVNVVDVEVDLVTRAVRVPEGLVVKRGDGVVLRVSFVKSGVVNALTLTDLKVVLKEYEGDGVLLEGTDFSGEDGVYLLYVSMTGDALAGVLADNETDKEAAITALWELQWLAENPLDVGPEEIVGSSQTFEVKVIRDLTV